MTRFVTFVIALWVVAPGPPAFGQGFNPYPPLVNHDDPNMQRARRERAVAYVGPVARQMVETYGDDACYALFACSPAVGRKLAQFHLSGDLERHIPRSRDLLRVISQPGAGDQVAWFAMQNALDLSDFDTCDAFIHSPLHYTLGLKTLSDGAAEIRAHRLHAEANPPWRPVPWLPQMNPRTLALCGGLLALIILVVWRGRRQGLSAAA